MTKRKNKPLFTGYEWDVDLIDRLWKVIDKIGREDLGLDYYQPQFDIVTAEQMLDAESSIGMPIYYNHWSFGKEFLSNKTAYKKGKMGLAYEIVINSNPCLAYLMEDNTATCTALVIAHANVGHAHFFKNNYLFKQHTDPNNILNFLEYAKQFILSCEEKYSMVEVEQLLDALHKISKYGIDKYPKKDGILEKERFIRNQLRSESEQKLYNHIFDSLPKKKRSLDEIIFSSLKSLLQLSDHEKNGHIILKEENLLKFIIDYSLVLEPWQLEIAKIIMNIEQYFYPQGQTKIMNEGFACFIHYHIMSKLYEGGYIDEGSYLEFLQLHTSVCNQPRMTHLNPYSIGFEIFMDIKRACENPDEEDYRWLKTIAGKGDWKKEIKNIVQYYKDESFILQFLSPKVIRKLKLFSFMDSAEASWIEITATHDDEDIEEIKRILWQQIELDNRKPDLEITRLDKLNNTIDMRYKPYKGRDLGNVKKLKDILRLLTGYLKVNIKEEQ